MERTEDGEIFFLGGGPVVFGHFFRFLDKIPKCFFWGEWMNTSFFFPFFFGRDMI